MHTSTFTAHDGSKFVLSAAESADGSCFLHITTRFGRFGLETEFTEYDHEWGNPLRSWILAHRHSCMPAAVQLHVKHEHVLATHQTLYRATPTHYLAHLVKSVAQQLKTEFLIQPLRRLI